MPLAKNLPLHEWKKGGCKQWFYHNGTYANKRYTNGTYKKGIYLKTVRNYNTGSYSSNISRLFHHVNNRIKNEEERKRGSSKRNERNERNEWETTDVCFVPLYKQYESIIEKMNFNKMLGRDLSHCMNILSKIRYFRSHMFWIHSCSKLCRGYMIHRINVSSFFLIANALSKIPVLYKSSEEKEIRNSMNSFSFRYIDIDLCNRKRTLQIEKNGNCAYHPIYNEIAFRFLADIRNMDLDSVSCVLNCFSKLSLTTYNVLGYVFADYFVFMSGKCEELQEMTCEKNYVSNDTNCSQFSKKGFIQGKQSLFDVTPKNVSKLTIILHSCAKLNIVHPEFYLACAGIFKKYVIHLNNIDVCNILYSFAKFSCTDRKFGKAVSLKRLRNSTFESYMNDIIKHAEVYDRFYVKENERNHLQETYHFCLNKDVILSDISEERNYRRKCVDMIQHIVDHLSKEVILNSMTPIQISSVALSLCKLRLPLYDIFYGLNCRVHFLWKHFSLYSIADFLYAMNEKNIGDDQVSLLLLYQFVKHIHKLWVDSLHKNLHVKYNDRKIDFVKRKQRHTPFLNERDLSLVARTFQSLSKSDLMSNFHGVDGSGEDSFPYKMNHNSIRNVHAKTNDRMELNELENTNYDQSKMNAQEEKECFKEVFLEKNGFISVHNKQRNPKSTESFWVKLDRYPDYAFPIFNSSDTHIRFLKFHILKSFYFCIDQHLEVLDFNSKCFLCFFSAHIAHYVCPLSVIGMEERYTNGEEVDPFFYIKVVKGHPLCITLSSKLLFHILANMKPESLNEVCMRQIYTCLFCLYLNIINISGKGIIEPNDRGSDSKSTSIGCVIEPEGEKFQWEESGGSNVFDIQTVDRSTSTKGIENNEYVLHLFSLEVLKNINTFLDCAREANYQQNEMTLTSKIHNEVYNSLRMLINLGSVQNRRIKVKQFSEVIHGPFVLDFVLLSHNN